MEGLHLLEFERISEFLAQDIHLPRHHFEEHDELFRFQIHKLLEHDPVIIEAVIASDKGGFRLPVLDVIRDIGIERLFGNIRQISDKNSVFV